jgi:hypothetical protein
VESVCGKVTVIIKSRMHEQHTEMLLYRMIIRRIKRKSTFARVFTAETGDTGVFTSSACIVR